MSTFLITLATGRQGGATARLLRAAGHTVRALVRDVQAPAAVALAEVGVELYQGTFDDVPTIRAAAAGATGIFLNLAPDPSDPAAELRQTQTVLAAAREAGSVTTIVLSTAYLAGKHCEWSAQDLDYPCAGYFASKSGCEAAVLGAGFPHVTILRPAWLMYNYIVPYAGHNFPELRSEHALATAYRPDTRMPHFDAADVGKFAAAALVDTERFSGQQIELGFENLTIEDVAAEMNRVLGVDVKVRYRGPDEIEALRTKVPIQMFHLHANVQGLESNVDSLREYGIPLTTLAEYLEREKGPLKEAFGI